MSGLPSPAPEPISHSAVDTSSRYPSYWMARPTCRSGNLPCAPCLPAIPGWRRQSSLRSSSAAKKHLQREAVWRLHDAPRAEALPVLRRIIGDPQRDHELRADAVAALAALAEDHAPAASFLKRLALRDKNPLHSHALRVLDPGRDLTKVTPRSPGAWRSIVSQSGDPENGRRVFFQHNGPGCHRCHRIHGRGGDAAPDLTEMMRQLDEERLLESILTPSKEVAPEFSAWFLATADGRMLAGRFPGSREPAQGKFIFVDQQGVVHLIAPDEIEEVSVSKKSLMPDNLLDALTDLEIRDLFSFLCTLKLAVTRVMNDCQNISFQAS